MLWEARASSSLVSVMPNFGMAKYSRRLLIAGVAKSILLYVVPIWAGPDNQKRVNSAWRTTALRVCNAFRTALDEAICVIAVMIPLGFLADGVHGFSQGRRGNILELIAEFRKPIGGGE